MGTPTRENFLPELLTDTPPRPPKKVLTTPAQHVLEEGRKAVMDDTGYAVPEVAIKYFKDYLLPPLRPEFGDLSAIVARLSNSGHLITDGPWALFKEPPEASKDHENTVFESFGKLVRKEAKNALPQGKRLPTTLFKCNPNMQPISSQRENTAMPDAYAVLRDPLIPRDAGKVYWDDVVVPGEMKKRRLWDTINDNNRKLMWSMNHAMRDTPRRRFVIGFTIENTSMRLWFCSRSDVIVSELFDFVKDHKTLIHFFFSIMYATPSDLGYDPTIVPAYTTDARLKGQHNIHVRSSDGTERIFQTIEIAANIGAEALRGRGTRVWRVVELDEHRKPTAKKFMLKDSWIDHDRTREGDILAEIRTTMAQVEEGDVLNNYLLTVECHGDVYIDGQSDNTHTVMRRGQEIPQDAKMWPLQQPCPKRVADEKLPIGPGLIEDTYVGEKEVVLYDIKSHYRIVFHEDGETIDKLTSLSDIWFNLSHVFLGLQVLHMCGWIHRDISAGNILVGNKYPKIVDFEYAKKVGDTSPIHRGRTGTDHFMPIEVKGGTWCFAPSDAIFEQKGPEGGPIMKLNAMMRELDARKAGVHNDKPSNSSMKPTAPWKPNPLHDIESFWWLCVILTICRAVVGAEELDRERASYHKQFVRRICMEYHMRWEIMTDARTFEKWIKWLPAPLVEAAMHLATFRTKLRNAYREAEQDTYSIDHTVANKYYWSMLGILQKYSAELAENDIKLTSIGSKFIVLPSVPVPPAASLSLDTLQTLYGKRLREEIEDGQINFKQSQWEPEAGPPTVTDLEPFLKRVKLSNSLSLVLKAPAQSVPSVSEHESESEPSQLPEASSSMSAKGKTPAVPKKKAVTSKRKAAAPKKKAGVPKKKAAARPKSPDSSSGEPRRSQRNKHACQ